VSWDPIESRPPPGPTLPGRTEHTWDGTVDPIPTPTPRGPFPSPKYRGLYGLCGLFTVRTVLDGEERRAKGPWETVRDTVHGRGQDRLLPCPPHRDLSREFDRDLRETYRCLGGVGGDRPWPWLHCETTIDVRARTAIAPTFRLFAEGERESAGRPRIRSKRDWVDPRIRSRTKRSSTPRVETFAHRRRVLVAPCLGSAQDTISRPRPTVRTDGSSRWNTLRKQQTTAGASRRKIADRNVQPRANDPREERLG